MTTEKTQDNQKKVALIKMIHMDTGAKVDVHPLEQLNYFRGGYRKVFPKGKKS